MPWNRGRLVSVRVGKARVGGGWHIPEKMVVVVVVVVVVVWWWWWWWWW